MLPEPKRRIRWLTRDERDRLIGALPEHLAAMARFSPETGLRRSNVTGLLWLQVDLTRRTAWVHADQAKAPSWHVQAGTPLPYRKSWAAGRCPRWC